MPAPLDFPAVLGRRIAYASAMLQSGPQALGGRFSVGSERGAFGWVAFAVQQAGQPQETPFWPLRLLHELKGEMQVDGPRQAQLKSPPQAFGIEMQCGRGPDCVTYREQTSVGAQSPQPGTKAHSLAATQLKV